jgi:hypothetical protein
MVAGGRIIYRKVEELGVRSGGSTLWRGVHSAFVCREDEFMPAYEKMWAELPEWDYDQAEQGPLSSDPGALGARTGMHGSAAGRKWKALYGRGDQIYDWDTNNFHLVGGISSTPTLARYQARYMEDRLHELAGGPQGHAAH